MDVELSPAHEKFCREYVWSGNQVRSYQKAYPGTRYNSAATNASRLLKNADIKARIRQLNKERNKRLQIKGDKVLRRLEARASFKPTDLYNDDGKLIPIHELDPDVAIGIKSITITRRFEGKGEDREEVEETRLTFFDGKASDELLGKNQKLWNDVGSKDNPLHMNVPLQVAFGDEDDEGA